MDRSIGSSKYGPIAVIAVESAVKYSFVEKCVQTRREGQYKAELTLSPRLHVKPLITAIPIPKLQTHTESPFFPSTFITIIYPDNEQIIVG